MRSERTRRIRGAVLLTLLAGIASVLEAQDTSDTATNSALPGPFGVHFQMTTVTQVHPSFDAPYSGPNSLSPGSEHETTVTSTLFVGARLWSGAELYADPELSGGSGLSHTFGIAGFPNGEAFRVGSPEPHVALARAFFRQTIAAGDETEKVEDGENQLGGSHPVKRWILTVGKFGITDIFDDNAYSHDPRTQFMNWADWTPGAWDYPADTRGYTWGAVVEYIGEGWAARAAAAAEPKVANGLQIDQNLREAHSFMLELERDYEWAGQMGKAKGLVFDNRADMGNYREAIDQANGSVPDIVSTRRPGRSKWGLVLNLEQPLGSTTGLFLRASWNDGRNESWAYAEIDRSVTVGAVRKAPCGSRPDDEAGLAAIVNGLSSDHRDYLAAGGLGFMLGDGRLNYGLEEIAELYYKALLRRQVWLTGDYQFVENPAYNRDRGPVHVFGLRLHVEL